VERQQVEQAIVDCPGIQMKIADNRLLPGDPFQPRENPAVLVPISCGASIVPHNEKQNHRSRNAEE
jgi:hypothetical protein